MPQISGVSLDKLSKVALSHFGNNQVMLVLKLKKKNENKISLLPLFFIWKNSSFSHSFCICLLRSLELEFVPWHVFVQSLTSGFLCLNCNLWVHRDFAVSRDKLLHCHGPSMKNEG